MHTDISNPDISPVSSSCLFMFCVCSSWFMFSVFFFMSLSMRNVFFFSLFRVHVFVIFSFVLIRCGRALDPVARRVQQAIDQALATEDTVGMAAPHQPAFVAEPHPSTWLVCLQYLIFSFFLFSLFVFPFLKRFRSFCLFLFALSASRIVLVSFIGYVIACVCLFFTLLFFQV
jgi:hypothetical protein